MLHFKKKITFFTLGCKVKQYDTQIIRESFLAHTYQEVSIDNDPDIIIVNSCTVTGKSDQKVRKLARSLKKRHPNAYLIVTGCYAERARQELENIHEIDLIVDNKQKYDILSLIDPNCASTTKQNIINRSVKGLEEHTRAFIKIQDGCESFCSYCIIPYVRGPIQSKDQDIILQEIVEFLEHGIKEIVLVGIHVGKYGKERTSQGELYELIEKIDKISGDFRLRLSSIEINELDNHLLQFLANSRIITPHFHIPLQAGDDSTLQRMNRHYTIDAFLEKCEYIRSLWKNPSFTTDVIVGFPGETEEQFQNTLKTCQVAKFSKIHIFPYSDRTGTPASKMENKINEEIKKERVQRLTKVAHQLTAEYLETFLHKNVRVLVETQENNMLTGFSDEYQRVYFLGNIQYKNNFVFVNIQQKKDNALYGIIQK
ncbi:MAG TPA: tRNA (N(6)-L-threonylcarbamoyladenosine(37)-C(2))-methylthiotransferase MtaB [Planctomycetota bacterium]|nr:tRNA (N(6)-L-threonylcarbamoyladenosine(37)-C(2))-methylthiotransferase MtaB [Planctomycetota bacterium]